MRIGYIQALASALNVRYHSLGQVDDLEQSILHYTEAIFLPPHRDRDILNTTQIFFVTARLLLLRATRTEHPEDVKSPVIYLRYLRGQSPEAFNISPDEVKDSLMTALALQVELELGDVMQDIEEMADLVLELLNSDTWTTSTDTITSFAAVVKHRYGKWGYGKEPRAKTIDCLRKAKIRLPDSDELSITLASTLLDRFEIAYSKDDYEEGTAILDKFLTSRGPGDEPSQYREALEFISVFAHARLNVSWKPEHLEEAIYRLRNCLIWIPPEDPIHPYIDQNLKVLQSKHFEEFGVGVRQEGHSYVSVYSASGIPSFGMLTASLESLLMAPEDQRFEVLSSTHGLTDIAEIEEAIEPCRLLLASFRPSFMHKASAVRTFGILLLRAFAFTNNIEYANEGISIIRDGLNLPNANVSGIVPVLFLFLICRFMLRHSRKDLDEIMQVCPRVVDDRSIKVPDRFQCSCLWAHIARFYSYPCTSTAYDYALSLMQDSLTFAPTVDIQHSRLVAMRNNYETLPLDCASYQVHTGQLQRAVETLKRGRALIWSEMRGLRSSIDQIRVSDPDLADKLAAINQDLEVLTLTLAQKTYGGGGEEGLEGMDPFGRLVVRQQGLLEDREKLISLIRSRKGLVSFLEPPSFDHLRSAAVRGPVIVINHCRWRSDIIILLRDSPPSLIPTANDFYDRANKLRDQLLGARKKERDSEEYEDALDSDEYEDILRSVLKELYELVGRPVIQRPLHAMGPIPSDSGPPQYFLDLYIPSYTPTLSALIESNKSRSQSLGKPSILLVLQPDERMTTALDEMRIVRSVGTRVKTLSSAKATPTAVMERLQDHPFVHIVCHGILEPGKPFDSSFKLYRGDRLTLMDIVRSQLPNAEFAFLAACHTAELTDESPSDESLHLAAAMQYCGFRSVVGTMWAMADKDGRRLAQNFYKSMFPPGESQEACYHEKTAEAL